MKSRNILTADPLKQPIYRTEIGGENYLGSRPLHYDWVERVHSSCVKHNVQFIFGQTGNVSIKDGKEYKIRNRTEQMVQALRSGLHYPPKDIEKEVNDIYARKQAMLEIKTKK